MRCRNLKTPKALLRDDGARYSVATEAELYRNAGPKISPQKCSDMGKLAKIANPGNEAYL
jgi:hypothetical protein